MANQKSIKLGSFVETPEYNIHEALVLSNEREIRQKGKNTYMPIYYVMFLRQAQHAKTTQIRM